MAIPVTFGPAMRANITALRRRAMAAVAEARGGRQSVDVLRRNPDGASSTSTGRTATWTTTTFAALVGHVRYNGKWKLRDTDTEVLLREDQRIIMVADLPAGAGADVNELLLSDRLRYTDDTYGLSVWVPVEIRDRDADGICWALCDWAREEGVA